jgi:hypothetical protein
MKRILIVLAVSFVALHTMAQTKVDSTTYSTKPKKKSWSNVILGDQANDHFLFQLGYSDFLNKQDSVSTKGIGRSVNMYFMMAFADKQDNRFSAAVGLGFGSDNYYLNKERIDLTNPARATFYTDTADDYRKSKLNATYIEIPLEARYSSNPANPNHAWKVALGVKAGLLAGIKTKVKMLRDINGIPDYTLKTKDDHLFNPVRAAGTLRVGYGVVSLFFQTDITSFIKSGDGPSIRPYTAGVTISGL